MINLFIAANPMLMIRLSTDVIFVSGAMMVGAWLEGINGISGAMDKFLTPFPLGCTALVTAFLEGAIA